MEKIIFCLLAVLIFIGCSSPTDSTGGNDGLVINRDAGTYIITGSGTSFTARNEGVTVGAANQSIFNVIGAIRNDASGKDCTIQFEDSGKTLDIGMKNITFYGDNWGLITLTGAITSDYDFNMVIKIEYGISVDSTADIKNTSAFSNTYGIYNSGTLNIRSGSISTAGTTNYVVYNHGPGTLNISGGTISSAHNTSYAVYSRGTVNISGGEITVTGTNSYAVYNDGGTANITGGNITGEKYGVND